MIRATFSIVSLIAAVALVASPASAVTWTDTGTTPTSWNVNTNWGAGPFPNATDAVADMNVDVTVNQTVNLNLAITVGALNLGDTNSTHTSTIAPAGGSLTFDVTAGNAALTKAASTFAGIDAIISAPVVLSDNLNITNNTPYVVNSVAGAVQLSGGISDGGSGNGITKLGTGVMSLTGGAANTYSGATRVEQGTLVVQAANSIPDASPISVIATGAGTTAVLRWGLGNAGVADTIGNLTLGGTTTTSQAIVNMSFNQTLTLNGNVTYDATNNPLGALIGAGTGGSPWSSGTVNLGGGTRTFNVGDSSSAGTDVAILHRIQNGSMIKDGFGRLDFNMASGLNTLTNVWGKR